MSDTNLIVMSGRLGTDCEVRYSGAGKAFGSFRMASKKSWKDRNGEWQERATWVTVKGFGNLAEKRMSGLSKGSLVHVTGRLEIEEWEDRNQQKRVTPTIFAEDIKGLQPIADGSGSVPSSNGSGPPPAQSGSPAEGGENWDDDVPF